MDYTDTVRETIAQALKGYSPQDIIETVYQEIKTLLENDPDYFSGGRGNAEAKTLFELANLVYNASK